MLKKSAGFWKVKAQARLERQILAQPYLDLSLSRTVLFRRYGNICLGTLHLLP
jgi:hypothetical protein